MGSIAEELSRWMTHNEPDAPATLVDLSDLVGNPEIARRAGVSVRTVERWLKSERGEEGQTRRPSLLHQARLNELYDEAPTIKLAMRIRDEGLTVNELSGDIKVSERTQTRTISAVVLDPGKLDLDDFAKAMEGGDYEHAAQQFAQLFVDAYSGGSMAPLDEFGTELTALDMGWEVDE